MLEWEEAMRELGMRDLFFLVNFILSEGRILHSDTRLPLFFHDFYLKLCKDVQWAMDNLESTFDGSARRGGKSTIRTKAGSIQLLLNHPDISICIFSVEKQRARTHLRFIKEELESNKLLKTLYHDILFDDPAMAAKNGETVWSMDEGLRVKRARPRANQTIEVNALFGGGPVGSGYDVIHFDDIEHGGVVSSQENLNKLHEAFAQAIHLATPAVLKRPIIFVTNTFFHPEGIAKKKHDEYSKKDPRLVRVEPAEDRTVDGDCPMGGTANYPFTPEILWLKYNECANKDEYAIQYLCDFSAGQDRSFQRKWLQFYDQEPERVMQNKYSYLCIDASKGIYDPMAGVLWSAGQDKKLYLTGGFRKKLDPASPEFFDEIFVMASKAANLSERLVEIRVEQIGQQTWAELIRSEMRKRGLFTPVIPCRGKLGKSNIRRFNSTKLEREWQRWSPPLQRGDIVLPLPKSMNGAGLFVKDEDGKLFDLVDYFLNFEYDLFPRAPHDDVLDAGALIWEPDMEITWPLLQSKRESHRMNGYKMDRSWMSA